MSLSIRRSSEIADHGCIERGSYTPVWDEVLESLQLGIYIEDPTRGPITH